MSCEVSVVVCLTSSGRPPALTSSMLVMLNIHTLKVSAGPSGATWPLKRAVQRRGGGEWVREQGGGGERY